jgi:hypothetical protein
MSTLVQEVPPLLLDSKIKEPRSSFVADGQLKIQKKLGPSVVWISKPRVTADRVDLFLHDQPRGPDARPLHQLPMC